MFRSYAETVKTSFEVLRNIYRGFANFNAILSERREELVAKARKVRVLMTRKNETYFLDDAGKLKFIFEIEQKPERIIAKTSPPLIPHFYLLVALLSMKTKFKPLAFVQTFPILSSACVLGKDATPIEALLKSLQVIFAGLNIEVIGFSKEFLTASVETETLYITDYGFSTKPLQVATFNEQVDFSEVEEAELNGDIVSLYDYVEKNFG